MVIFITISETPFLVPPSGTTLYNLARSFLVPAAKGFFSRPEPLSAPAYQGPAALAFAACMAVT